MVVVLFSSEEGTPTLRPAAFEQLAELGVTSVSLLRDGSTAAFVFEGWAFNVRHAADAAHVLAGACDGVRTLKPLLQIAVSPAAARIDETVR